MCIRDRSHIVRKDFCDHLCRLFIQRLAPAFSQRFFFINHLCIAKIFAEIFRTCLLYTSRLSEEERMVVFMKDFQEQAITPEDVTKIQIGDEWFELSRMTKAAS